MVTPNPQEPPADAATNFSLLKEFPGLNAFTMIAAWAGQDRWIAYDVCPDTVPVEASHDRATVATPPPQGHRGLSSTDLSTLCMPSLQGADAR